MTTDSWEQAKAGFAGLWRRHHPEQARAVETDLETARTLAAAARQAGDGEAIEDLAAEWRSRLRRATGTGEEFPAEVRQLVEELRPLLAARPTDPVVMVARASGSSRVYQAGRDLTVTAG